MDANEATAYVAYRVNEVCAIYPITPSTSMGELADAWSTEGKKNIWGNVPHISELQSEAGASGSVHGSLQCGALTTTFTASQGLLLMIPNLFKIAGELTPAVLHVAARSIACQSLSIFCDHSDVMSCRTTGVSMLSSSTVQEAHHMALIAQAATLKSRIPFIHFFDGFRTSHELNKIELLSDEQIEAMIDDDLVIAHRNRGLTPEKPVVRGTAQNPDVFFQGRETVNSFYEATPDIVQEAMDKFAELTGVKYRPFDYYGAADAERVIIIMGSGADTLAETVPYINETSDEKVGYIVVRLYRPFSVKKFLEVVPATTKTIAVLDRTKEPGATGEPLYQDIVTAFNEGSLSGTLPTEAMPKIVGGRYGISSKEFTPAMIKGIFDEMKKDAPKNHFTVGIIDDVTNTNIDYDAAFTIQKGDSVKAMFYGLGSDGTVGANKNSIKIIGEETDNYAQGYFVYDSKKSGSKTISHLRFGPEPIHAPYLIQNANFIGCHQFPFLDQIDILKNAAQGATFLINSPYSKDDVWQHLPKNVQQQILDKGLKLYVIDAYDVARKTGMGARINTIMQTCFFAISGVLPKEEAIAKIKEAIEKTYSKKGEEVVKKNFEAVDSTLENLYQVEFPKEITGHDIIDTVPDDAPEFVKEFTAEIMAGRGDDIPVSKMPVDGTYPSGTTKWEKRNISPNVSCWDPETCIQCGNCSFVCPHGVIRAKTYDKTALESSPKGFKSADVKPPKGAEDKAYTLQIYQEDCTGCGLCVEACPVKNKENPEMKAINMVDKASIFEQEKKNVAFFETLPDADRKELNLATVKGLQSAQPLFEFSGACAGCGETPYVKLLSQLYGERLLVANATGCSSIYGGNLPTTPWTHTKEGRGPAWANSLFEDNAEFGFGFLIASEKRTAMAKILVKDLAGEIGEDLARDLVDAEQNTEEEIQNQHGRVAALKEKLQNSEDKKAKHLVSLADNLLKRSIWTVGGDGWAYDIGYGGLDHALASGKNVKVLVLDTEVYSNTGGQMSKATPRAAVAKFAAGGKKGAKKDLAMMMTTYGNIYVARIAMGANQRQAIQAIREAEEHDGPAIVVAYSQCIAHGIDMRKGMNQQKLAVECGYWPLMRYNPKLVEEGKNPFVLDSKKPTIPLKDYAYNEVRYTTLIKSDPEEAARLLELAQKDVDDKWKTYETRASQG